MTTIIPAAAGYYGIWPAKTKYGYGRAPIIGWSVHNDRDGVPEWSLPLIDGEAGIDIIAILCPDGSVNQADGGHFWPDIHSWLADPDFPKNAA